jgi:hypothetical protein
MASVQSRRTRTSAQRGKLEAPYPPWKILNARLGLRRSLGRAAARCRDGCWSGEMLVPEKQSRALVGYWLLA